MWRNHVAIASHDPRGFPVTHATLQIASFSGLAPHVEAQPDTSMIDAAVRLAPLIAQSHLIRFSAYLSAAVAGATPAGLGGLHVNLLAGLESVSSRFHQPPPSA